MILFELTEKRDDILVKTISRWVYDDKSDCMYFFLDFLIMQNELLCFASYKVRLIFTHIDLSIMMCIDDRIFIDFDTDDEISFALC